MECSYDDCGRVAARTSRVLDGKICKRHQLMEWHARQGECSLDHCDRQINADGICVTHYKRKRLGLPDWDKPIPRRMKRGGHCLQGDDCDGPVYARGLCAMHYARVHVLGHADPGPAKHLKAASGTGTSDGRGYWVITVDGKRYLEHRWVMEQMLGRPLYPDEEVHHKNRVRDDNDPDNLELWTTAQPRGGRAEDLVRFYVGRYPELAARVLADIGG
jgi:hypothetical protein